MTANHTLKHRLDEQYVQFLVTTTLIELINPKLTTD